jgi:hypothetical protein
MSEKYRLDARLLDGEQTAVVVCLPRAYVNLLLDWSTRLKWSIYIDQDGNRVSPGDTQKAMLEIGYKGLVEAMCLEELTSILDLRLSAIASAIGNISGGSVEIDIQPLTSAVLEVSSAVGELTAVMGQGEEEEVNIVNNLCCCSCGNGGNGGNPDDNLPPDIPPDDLPLPPLPDGTNEPYDPGVFPVTAGVCAIVHYTLVQWRNLCIAIGNGEVTRVNMIERLNATLPGVLSPVSGISWMVTAVQMALYLALYLVGFVGRGGDVAREIDGKFEVLKCIVLNDAPFAEKIAQGRVIIGSFALPSTLKMVIGILWQFLPFSGMRLFSSADQMYLTLLPSWAFVPCPPCVGGGGGDDDPINLGVWVHNGSSGHCGESSDETTAVWNTATRYNQNVTLSKTSSSGSYTWNISRNGNIGSDADYILIDLELTGHVTGYILRFYNVSSSVVHELDLGAETSQTIVIPYAAWFGSVTSVTLLRDSESYTQACPRIFGIDFSITAPGSSTWEQTET